MKYLVRGAGGYYKEGVKQVNYDNDDVINCYIHIMDRIYGTYTYKLGAPGRVKYDPEKGNLASFIHTWVRGFSSDTIKKQQRRYKKNFHKIFYLEDILSCAKSPKNCVDSYSMSDTEDSLDVSLCLDSNKTLRKMKYVGTDSNFDLFYTFLVKNTINLNVYNALSKQRGKH